MDFDLKELVRQTVLEIANEEMLERIIREEVRERFEYQVNRAIRDAALQYVCDKGDGYIRERIEEVFHGRVMTDDGWGNRKDMGTFEDYVRKTIREKTNNSWDIERKVRNAVDEKLKTYITAYLEGKKENAVDSVLAMVAEDYAKESS